MKTRVSYVVDEPDPDSCEIKKLTYWVSNPDVVYDGSIPDPEMETVESYDEFVEVLKKMGCPASKVPTEDSMLYGGPTGDIDW